MTDTTLAEWIAKAISVTLTFKDGIAVCLTSAQCERVVMAIRSTAPKQIECLAAREEIAAQLMDRDEGGGCLDWARKFVAEGKNTKHSGDCTNESHPCNRCLTDRALADADRLIAALRSTAPVVTEERVERAALLDLLERALRVIQAELIPSQSQLAHDIYVVLSRAGLTAALTVPEKGGES